MAERKLEWLEVMRGGAALWVLLHHAKQSIDHFVVDMGSQPWFERGYLGVDFFFVLSGFIIAFASHRLTVRGGGLRDYASARLIRIYVPYLPIGIVMYLLYLLAPDLSDGARSVSLLTSLTLLPDARPPALSVAWTLVHEMIFYCLYGLSFLHKRLFIAVFGGWVATILAVAALEISLSPVVGYFLSPVNLCFVLGVLIFHVNHRWTLGPGIALTLALLGLGLVGWQAMASSPNRVVVAAGFGMAVWAASSPASSHLKAWRPLVVLGAASYAVYLVHNPALSLLVRLLPPDAGAALAYLLIAAGSLVAGILYWWLYERPMLAKVREWIGPRRAFKGAVEGS